MNIRFLLSTIISLIIIVTSTSSSAGSLKQFQNSVAIGGRVSGAVIILGWDSDGSKINKLIDLVAQRANEAYSAINSDINRLNSGSTQGPVTVSWQAAECLSRGIQVSKWTKMDIVTAEGSSGSYKDISVNEKSKTVELKQPGIRIKADSLINGYIADIMIRYIYGSGMQNSMVKVGNVFRGVGQGMHGPWKIQVQEDSSTFARHALNLTVSNTGVATISSTQLPGRQIYDPKARRKITTPCKGATIIMNEAALAEGVAYSIMIAGPKKGMDILTKLSGARGLIVDQSGKFLRRGL